MKRCGSCKKEFEDFLVGGDGLCAACRTTQNLEKEISEMGREKKQSEGPSLRPSNAASNTTPRPQEHGATPSANVLPMPDNDQPDDSQYKTARALLQFFSVIGWLVVALGIIGALMLVADQGMSAIMSAATTAVAGLFLIAITQVTQALLDSADHLREIKSDIKRANGLS